MTNPFQPRIKRTPAVSERLSELEGFVVRLRAVGATDDEVETVRATWNEFDGDWTMVKRKALTLLPDVDLRAEILATRAEYDHDTTSSADQATADAASHWERTLSEAAEVVGRTIPQVMEWVGSDQIRAIAAAELESGEHGAGRKTLLATLRPIIEGET